MNPWEHIRGLIHQGIHNLHRAQPKVHPQRHGRERNIEQTPCCGDPFLENNAFGFGWNLPCMYWTLHTLLYMVACK
jgi:hypothetical protein